MLKKAKETASVVLGLGLYVFLMWISGIGCPIKWVTGVSCAGCGMTRAVWNVLCLRFDEATYCHPLVWIMPVCAGAALFWEKIPRRVQKILVCTMLIAFFLVYVVRMADPDNHVVEAVPESGAFLRLIRFVYHHWEMKQILYLNP